MSVQLPEPIAAYLDAENAGDPGAVARCFTGDAVVRDEGRTIVGAAALQAWKAETSGKYRHCMEALACETQGDLTLITNRLTGSFPGSPIVLTFAFRLARGKIAALEIRS